MPRSCQAAVFDCDGLLLDTTASWHEAFHCAAETVDVTLTAHQLAALAGRSVESAASAIAAWAEARGETRRLAKTMAEALQSATERDKPRVLGGARAVLKAVSGRIPLGVASNAPAATLTHMLATTGLLAAFDTVVSADEVAHPKPAPDVYLAACLRLEAAPAATVALEDSRVGANAAQRAGLALIVVTNSDWPCRDPLRWPATGRPVLYVTNLGDPAVRSLILGS